MDNVKNSVIPIKLTTFIGVMIAFAILIPFNGSFMTLQAQNATTVQNSNDTEEIWVVKNRTIVLVNTTTNESKIIGQFGVAPENATTNETLSTTTGNTTTNESKIIGQFGVAPENATTNETLSTTTGNTTTKINLTAKFEDLQGK